jgi:hypothetical protein
VFRAVTPAAALWPSTDSRPHERGGALMRRYSALRAGVALATVLGAGIVATAPTLAATPAVTTQALAADAAFLAYAPAPAGGAGALCLVDTGVDVNPDTQGRPDLGDRGRRRHGNDVDPDEHGTTMAMIAGGAGHGMIGAWPQIKIVSVRATTSPARPGANVRVRRLHARNRAVHR